MQIPFLGPTYPARSLNIAADRCINFYPEVGPQDSKGAPNPNGGVIALIGTPGSVLAFTVAGTVIRGMHVFNNLLYFVAGNTLYSVDSVGTVSSSLGTLATSSGRVSIIDNGMSAGLNLITGQVANQLYIVDGTNAGYIYDILSSTFTATTGGRTATFLLGYFITNTPGSRNVISSDSLNGLTFEALAYSSIIDSSDNVQCVINLNDQLWIIKEFHAQIWTGNGQPTSLSFPFSQIPGTTIDYGTPAPDSVARADQALFYVASARQGDSGKFAGIVMVQGNTPQIISPPAINYQISQFGDISDAFGFCRVHEGHSFYVVTFPSAYPFGNSALGATFVYDRSTQLWHEWSSYLQPYQIGRHKANCYAYFAGKEYFGDFSTGNIYELSSNYYQDSSEPIVSMRVCQHQYNSQDLDNIFINRLQVDMETGVGDLGLLNQTGIDPMSGLSWSNDGGHTFGNDYLGSIGKVGKYKTRLMWRRLGYARDRVFKLTISDPVKKVITGAFVK